jgi:hypothetical protein
MSMSAGEVGVRCPVGAGGDRSLFFDFLTGVSGAGKLVLFSTRDFLCSFFFSVPGSSWSLTCFLFLVLCESCDRAFPDPLTGV